MQVHEVGALGLSSPRTLSTLLFSLPCSTPPSTFYVQPDRPPAALSPEFRILADLGGALGLSSLPSTCRLFPSFLPSSYPAPPRAPKLLLSALLPRPPLQSDLYLSPEFRILADLPGVSTFTYDGAGHRIILPPGLHPTESLPLILIGPARTLRLVNVTLVNSSSLAACLQLGPGASLVAEERDGARLVVDAAAAAAAAAHHYHKGQLVLKGGREQVAGKAAGAGAGATGARGDEAAKGVAQQSGAEAPQQSQQPPQQPPQQQQRFEVQLDAIGANFHIIDSSARDLQFGPLASGGGGGSGSAPLGRPPSTHGGANWMPTAAGPGTSGAAASARSRSMGSAVALRSTGSLVGLATAAAAAAAARGGAGQGQAAAVGVLRRLTLVMDVSATYRVQVGRGWCGEVWEGVGRCGKVCSQGLKCDAARAGGPGEA